VHPAPQAYKTTTSAHLHSNKRAGGRRIINQLIAQLSSLKYVHAQSNLLSINICWVLGLRKVHGWQNKQGGWVTFSPNDISAQRRPKNVKFGTKVASSTTMMGALRFLEKGS